MANMGIGFNVADIVVVTIILSGLFLGYKKGVITMALSLLSVLMAVVVTFFIQPILLPLLTKYTGLMDYLVDVIYQNINLSKMADSLTGSAVGDVSQDVNPQIMAILQRRLGVSSIFDEVQAKIAYDLAGIALQIISFIIGFIFVVLLFAIVSWILSGMGKLPVIKEVNKASGAIVGAVIAVLLIWLVMLFMNYWFSTGQLSNVMSLIDGSLFAKYLYRYNLLVYYLILLQ